MFSSFVILQHAQWMYRTSFFFLFLFFFFFLRGSCGELPVDCQFSLKGYWYILVVACPILYICIYMLWGHFNYMISNFFCFVQTQILGQNEGIVG